MLAQLLGDLGPNLDFAAAVVLRSLPDSAANKRHNLLANRDLSVFHIVPAEAANLAAAQAARQRKQQPDAVRVSDTRRGESAVDRAFVRRLRGRAAADRQGAPKLVERRSWDHVEPLGLA